MQPLVSIVIVCMDRMDLLRPCLDSIRKNTSVTYETFVVAYMFSEANLAVLKAGYPWVTVVESRELRGFAENNNLALNPSLQYVDTAEPEQHGLIASQMPEAETRVILNTSVALKIYRCADVGASAEIEVSVPESEKDVTVRITLQAEGSNMELEAVSYVCSASAYRTQNVKLNLPDGRKYWYTVYLDGAQTQRVAIE